MTLLIADDEELVRFSIKDMLKDFPFSFDRILEASNGSELMARFRDEAPQIVLADIRMPGLSGLEALEALGDERQDSVWIILTGYSDFNYAQKALRLNVLDYLLKPPSPEELKAVLEKAAVLFREKRKRELFPEDREDGPSGEREPENRSALLALQAKRLMEELYDRDVGIAQVADKLKVTPNYLSSVFHEQTGMKFTRYLTELRLNKAKALLRESSLSVKEIATRVGYGSGRYFAGLFRQETGISPTEYMKKHRS